MFRFEGPLEHVPNDSDTIKVPEDFFVQLGDAFQKRTDVFAVSDDPIALQQKIDTFVHNLEDRLGLDTLQQCAMYYVLLGDFDDIWQATRFDLDPDVCSMRDFLDTL